MSPTGSTADGRSMDVHGPLRAAVIQDACDGRVLMVGWMDDAAIEATRVTGLVHFHSRSRDRLWRKGEISGNSLRVRSIEVDCDSDAYLIGADPAGPTCHSGSRSCFDARAIGIEGAPDTASRTYRTDQGFDQLEALWATIQARHDADPTSSYTARLLAAGVDAVGRKVVEEATEVLMAAKDHAVASGEATVEAGDPHAELDVPGHQATRARLTEESADLLYHLFVLLAERGLEPHDVVAVLRGRARGA